MDKLTSMSEMDAHGDDIQYNIRKLNEQDKSTQVTFDVAATNELRPNGTTPTPQGDNKRPTAEKIMSQDKE